MPPYWSEYPSDRCKVRLVSARVNQREYDASRRRLASQERRHRILSAARQTFVDRGYGATTMSSIAAGAGVALDTVYELVGRKPALFRLLIETAISGQDEPVAAEERDYVRAIREEPDAERKLSLYTAAIRRIHARLAPLIAVLQEAAPADPELATLWREIGDRRAANMRLFAQDLAATGRLRVPVGEAADVIWSTSSAELYLLLVHQRQWAPERYEAWLLDAWERLLLSAQG
jgi:AcrR family transcriptional regulator